jgi:carboxypeptidase C (cathepsin A)
MFDLAQISSGAQHRASGETNTKSIEQCLDWCLADFTFLTIRMAGHMVPNTQPAAALTFFNHFLHNTTHRF